MGPQQPLVTDKPMVVTSVERLLRDDARLLRQYCSALVDENRALKEQQKLAWNRIRTLEARLQMAFECHEVEPVCILDTPTTGPTTGPIRFKEGHDYTVANGGEYRLDLAAVKEALLYGCDKEQQEAAQICFKEERGELVFWFEEIPLEGRK